MDKIIQTSLFQNKSCILPGIGTLAVITNPAENDFINTVIKSPVHTIVFTEDNNHADFFNKFSDNSEFIKNTLLETGSFHLNGIGTFTKNFNENIRFVGVALPRELTQPVKAERVTRQNVEHTMLVGDKETTNLVMTNYLNEEEIKTAQKKLKKKIDYWWTWAIGLAAIAVIIIGIYFSQNKLNGFSFGNTGSINAAPANTDTYLKNK
jgi:hypothetical protein